MVQPYNIGVKVGADIDPLRQELNKGSKEIQGFAAQSSAALRTMASGFAVVGTAAVAAGGAILKLAADSAAWADDVNNMAKAAGTTAEMFQEMTFASKTLGVEQQKLSDIMRNSQKNLGEFALTGGGPLQKFFDDVIYKTGKTKQSFRDLSGPEGLQKFYNALEDAKLPQDQIISQMEKLAAGSSILIPLLQDNGAEMENLGKQARDAGAILSNEGVAALADLNLKFDLLKAATASSGRALAELLTPEVNAFIEAATKAANETTNLIGRLKAWRQEKESDAATEQKISDIIGRRIDRRGREIGVASESARKINALLKEQADLQERIDNPPSGGGRSGKMALQRYREELPLLKEKLALTTVAIEQARLESAEAARVYDLRKGVNDQIQEQIVAQEALNSASSLGGGGYEDEFGPGFLRDPFDPSQTDDPKKARTDEFSFGEDDPFATEQELFAKHWEEMNRIAVEGAGGISQIMALQWGNAVGSTAAAGKSMLESFSQSSRKMFEINKAWGIADAIVSTAQGIAAGVKLGWPMGIPAVAWAVANGAAQISRIRATQFGGGGGTPTATTSAPAQGQAAPGTNALGGQESGRTLRIEGLRADSLYTGNQLQNLATNLEEFWNDGGGKGRVIFAGDK